MAITTKTWITGEEFGRERRQLLAAGRGAGSPDYEALRRRVTERDEYIFAMFGRPLIERHRGKWAAISIDGEAIIEERDVDALRKGRERFGPGNFCFTRLDKPRGTVLATPDPR